MIPLLRYYKPLFGTAYSSKIIFLHLLNILVIERFFAAVV